MPARSLGRRLPSWPIEWALALPFALAALGCRSPTQIDVVVTTDLACAQVAGTSVTAGTLGEIERIPPASTTTHCVSGAIGSVVLIPSGDDGALVAFKVVTAIDGQDVERCTPDDAGSYGSSCIVARRAIRYLPHTPLQVDVLMSGECAGNACDPKSTCVKGACVPATIGDPTRCEGDGCSEQVLAADAGAPDATALVDAAVDASTSDSGPSVPGCDVAGALAGAAWPMEGYCPAHRNRSPLVGPIARPTVRWTQFLGGNITAAPSIGPDGTLYVSAFGTGAQSSVYALDPVTGRTLWRYAPDSGAAFATMPVLAADGTVRVLDVATGTYDVLDLDAGTARLVAPLASVSDPSTSLEVRGGFTLIGDGTMYGSDNEGHLFEFDSTGTVGWIASSASSDYVYPSVQRDGTVMTTTTSVNAFTSGGAPLWTYDAGASEQLTTVAVAVDGTLRVESPTDGRLYALEADGGLKWSVAVEQGQTNLLAVGDDGTTYVGEADDLTAWDANGTALGTYPGPCDQPVIDAAGDVYDTCSGKVVKLDSTLRNVKWVLPLAFDPSEGVNDSLVIGPGGTLFVSVDTESSTQADGGPPDLVVGIGP